MPSDIPSTRPGIRQAPRRPLRPDDRYRPLPGDKTPDQLKCFFLRQLRDSRSNEWLVRIATAFREQAPEEALQSLDRAKADLRLSLKPFVRELVSPVVDWLIERGEVEQALHTWWKYRFGDEGQRNEQVVLRALEQGWSAARLGTGEERLVFKRPQHFSVAPARVGFACRCEALGVDKSGLDPVRALRNAVRALRKEALHLHKTLTHTLTPAQRRRKGQLLGMVDLARSGLLEGGPAELHVVGQLAQDADGSLWLESRDSARRSFRLPPKLVTDEAGPGRYCRAIVGSGSAGEPVGPVQSLEVLQERSARELRREWMRVARQKN